MRTRLIPTLALLVASAAAQSAPAPACSALAHNDPQRAPLSQLCEFARVYRRTLPNFICEQETVSTPSWNAPPRTLVQQVTYENGHATYSDQRVNGKPGSLLASPGRGAFETRGEFGDDLIDLFTPGLVEFQFVRRDRYRGVDASVFSLHIPQQSNQVWTLSDTRRTIAPEFRGTVWIGPDGQPLRLQLEPVNLPPDFQMATARMETDYSTVNLAEAGTHVLPTQAKSRVCMHPTPGRAPQCIDNTLRFRGCHRFAAKARIVPSPE